MNIFDSEKNRFNVQGGFAAILPQAARTAMPSDLSGGKDSAVTAALCVRAPGKERVIGYAVA